MTVLISEIQHQVVSSTFWGRVCSKVQVDTFKIAGNKYLLYIIHIMHVVSMKYVMTVNVCRQFKELDHWAPFVKVNMPFFFRCILRNTPSAPPCGFCMASYISYSPQCQLSRCFLK